MTIALASPTFPLSIDDGLTQIKEMVSDAASQGAKIVCFPESFIPGCPLGDLKMLKASQPDLQNALDGACTIAKQYHTAIILPMDWFVEDLFFNVAFVISNKGLVLGYQAKCQLDPTEDGIWAAGTKRDLFEIDGLKFGIAICHEGFRYPESVRWAAVNGAVIVFHPHFTGSDESGNQLKQWGATDNPYYEKAMIMRAAENTIYFASVNYATKFQESATSLI